MKLALHIDSLVPILKTYYCIDGTALRAGTNGMYYKVIVPAMHNVAGMCGYQCVNFS